MTQSTIQSIIYEQFKSRPLFMCCQANVLSVHKGVALKQNRFPKILYTSNIIAPFK